MPKVSILVPVYNVEKYLKECLESLVSQTLSDIEIVCVNDGSTDNSLNILEEFKNKDNRIVIINKENSGYGSSMNIALNTAKGEYIGIVESDDFVKNNMFEDLYKIASKNNADVVKSDYFYYLTSSNEARKAGKISKYRTNQVINAKKYLKLLKMQPTIWNAIYKKDFLIKNDIKFLETPGASYQDTSFSFKVMASASRVVLTDKAYLYYRQDNISSSVHQKNKVFYICDEYDEITRFLNEKPEIKKFANSQKLIRQYRAYIWNLKRIDEVYRDSFIEKFSNTYKEFEIQKMLDKAFYSKINKNEVSLLLNDKVAFRALIDKMAKNQIKCDERKKLFSIRINPSRISIVLFGKQIVEIENNA
ncbi:MAG: glycosyltransferase [Candidatus Gastranaerophilales bacterium]|nr:glycosyltransferase [Candidatus Gastranaerophilales bacterium]